MKCGICVLYLRPVAVLLFVTLLASLPGARHSSRGHSGLVAGQGLDVSADNLGAGAEATANEFEQFESALELATTGGRGRCACLPAVLIAGTARLSPVAGRGHMVLLKLGISLGTELAADVLALHTCWQSFVAITWVQHDMYSST